MAYVPYPDIPAPTLAGSSSGQSVVSSKRIDFDYRSRVTRLPKQLETLSVSFVFNDTELSTFKSFLEDTLYTTKFVFTADWFLSGNDNVDKVLRMSTLPTLSALGLGQFNVSYNVEILNYGVARSEACPLNPYITLYPSDTLYPC